ncbi:MAG: IPT/TIG domain-containing protein [Deltaproteobacteria bacterium]|nr:IPT/TIG domain-containing protein [Deltaproteobacteria bacterium]
MSSTALKVGGWDFLAKTAGGATRNTEQSGALAVDYNQTTHPGVLRFPISNGEIWQSSNNSQNMLLRDLPSDWTSIRLKISAFSPNADHQQVGLLAYQNDDTYVSVRRNYNNATGGPNVGSMYEVGGVGTIVERRVLTNTGNLILRLDRNVTTNAYTPYYSVDGGTTWVTLLGAPALTLSNPRVAIQVGANGAGTLPVADLAWVEILRPAPVLSGVDPTSGVQGQTLTSVGISGSNFQSGATCGVGVGITVASCTFTSATQLTANLTIGASATPGARTITVTNPDTQNGSLANAFIVTAPAPVVSGVNPNTGAQGQTLASVVITGSNFQSGATCSVGAGITVTSCTFNSTTQLTANITITGAASTGVHAVSVTNPDTQSGSLANAFTVTAASSPLPPSISAVSPGSGAQGQTLTGVVITGSDFQSGATCSFGAEITVTSCTFNSATQLTANVTIAAGATTGGYTVSVTNPDAQSGNLPNAFSVVAPSSTAPVVSLLTPDSGVEGQNLIVTLTGSNFALGATCNFGGGVVVNSCLFNSTTQLVASITIAANAVTTPPVETRTVTVMNPDTQSGAFQNGFSISANTSSLPQAGHFDFTYPDRTSLLADNWDYVAKTASGGTRNTEQTGSLAVDYSQATHPGTIRVPLTTGEIWQTSNNSSNTLFRNLPSDWTSLRLKIASFNPISDYQQVGLLAYQNDDKYISVRRNYNSSAGGPSVGGMYEVNGVGTVVERRGLTNTGNLILRLDRNLTTNTYIPYYSVDGGTTWISLTGIPAVVLSNPRLAIQVGANLAASTQSADLAWVEVIHPNSLPAPTVSGVAPGTCEQGQQCTVTVTGTNFQSGAACTFGAGVTVNSCAFISATQLTADLAVLPTATVGTRTVTVLNPDTQAANFTNGFGVTTATPVTPTVSTVNPNTGSQGQNLLVTITGANFQFGATCDFGAGILVQACSLVSSTQLMANVTVTGGAALGTRTVTATNPGIVGGSLANAFSVTVGNLPVTNTLTLAVLVNSANSTGYNPTSGTPGEFQRYPKLYLDHLQVPYDVIDTATTPPPASLGNRQLILAGHTGLNLSNAWQSVIVSAVNGGTGFINLDAAPTVGTQTHIQSLFGATGSSAGTPATIIRVPAAVAPGGATPHFIAALQRKFLGDPAGDNVYTFHADANNVVQTVTATVLTAATGTVVAQLGTDPLIVARQTAAGRVVHFGSYLYLKADRFGFVQGIDDLFWRSLVWAARKPFVLRGYPRYWAVQMDDTMPGWETRVKDMYTPALTGTTNASGVGGPWKVTGYLFTENFPAGNTARASVISDIQSGKLQVAPHSFTNISYGDMYWHAAVGQNPRSLTDGEWTDNLAAILGWKQGNGGSDVIPSFSRSLVAHFWDLSNNTGYDLWNTLGFRYITSVQKPGFQRPANSQTVNVYNGAERLYVEDFWPYELPPKLDPSESTSFFFADDYPVGSRAGLPSQHFFLFTTQYIDLSKYPRNDFIWPSATYNLSPAASADLLQRYTWRHWSGMSPVQLFTHDIVNYEYATQQDRQTVIQQASTWLNANDVRHVFMENLGDYMYAHAKSTLVDAVQTTGGVQVTLTGNAATPDGAPVATQFLVFYQDAEGTPVSIPGFTGGTTAAMALP